MTVSADSLELFPGCPTFGFAVQPQYNVRIIEREGGYERRDRRWSRPLVLFTTVPTGDQSEEDIGEILAFWHAMGGRATAFRFKDWTDYRSAPLGTDITALDQPIAYTAGSPGGYQLTKEYTVGNATQVREIYKPKGDTIRVANASGIEQASSSFTIDEATGLLSINGGFAGIPTTWGGEFYVKVRFDSELDLTITNHRVQAATFSLKELRVEL